MTAKMFQKPFWRDRIMKRADLPVNFFDLVPQGCTRLIEFERMSLQPNAIWDMLVTQEGRIFVSLCSELAARRSAMLFEYQKLNHSLKMCFDVAREVSPLADAILPSKIHSSMSEMEDGRIIMCSHTTVAARNHVGWLFPHYFDHIWEGFQGSNLLIYNPTSGLLENLGIPVIRDSVYGGCYDPKHQAYYFTTYLRGHFYRYDLNQRRVEDLGQCSEFGTFRLVRGSDGHIYFTTRSGWLSRINVDTSKPELLGIRLQGKPMAFGCVGPDDRLYISEFGTDNVYAYECQKNQLQSYGRLNPKPDITKLNPHMIMGMAFDRSGKLWYGYGATSGYLLGSVCRLVRCDILKGREPEDMGMLGIENRNTVCISEMHIHEDTLYIADTNHCEDPPAVIEIDISKLEDEMSKPRKICRDPMAYYFLDDGSEWCQSLNNRLVELDVGYSHSFIDQSQAVKNNPYYVQAEKAHVIHLWRELPVEESSVREIRWDQDGHVRGICGNSELRTFDIDDGKLVSVKRIDGGVREHSAIESLLAQIYSKASLPSSPGRQHLAKAVCTAPWRNDQKIVGTLDGRLAIVDMELGKSHSLGAVVSCGPVRQIVTNRAKIRAFGVAGDSRCIGSIFYYDDEAGIRELGWVGGEHQNFMDDVGHSSEPCCLALSPDEHSLAVGVSDRMGCVYIFYNIKIHP